MKEGLLAPAGGTLQAVGLSSRVMITFFVIEKQGYSSVAYKH